MCISLVFSVLQILKIQKVIQNRILCDIKSLTFMLDFSFFMPIFAVSKD